MDRMTLRVVTASDPESIAHTALLFRMYQDDLGVDLCTQGFEEEIAALPGLYSLPRGVLFIGLVDDEPVACGAVRPLEAGICEMKRIFIRPEWRGYGYGRRMTERLVEFGRISGYERMRLDTLARLTPAVQLYRTLGFTEIPPYYDIDIPDVVFFELDLLKSLGPVE